MKKIKLCYLSILFVVFNFQLISQTGTKTITCLFLGNSYTYVNDLPLLIDSLAKANGDDLVYDQNTPGGHTFNNHFNNATSLAKINLQAWQYVVLQAQSQEPSFSLAHKLFFIKPGDENLEMHLIAGFILRCAPIPGCKTDYALRTNCLLIQLKVLCRLLVRPLGLLSPIVLHLIYIQEIKATLQWKVLIWQPVCFMKCCLKSQLLIIHLKQVWQIMLLHTYN
jgi:hypothetical protein